MVSDTLSDSLLQAIIWCSVGLLALILLLLLLIILLHLKLLARADREQRFIALWRPLLAATIVGENVKLPILAKHELPFFLQLWNHLQGSLRGEAKTRLNELARRINIIPHVQHMLRQRALRPRLLALFTLGHLGEHEAWEEIQQLARGPDPLISLVAARSLLQIDATAGMQILLPLILQRADWSPGQLSVLLKETVGEETFAQLHDAAIPLASSDDPEEQAQLTRLLRLLEVAPPNFSLPVARTVLSFNQPPALIAASLKFLCEPQDLFIIRPLIAHPDWIVRLQAARALGRIGTKEELPLVMKLMNDPEWWVRYRAAQALLSITHNTPQVLAEVQSHLEDRFAQDMLQMVKAERTAR